MMSLKLKRLKIVEKKQLLSFMGTKADSSGDEDSESSVKKEDTSLDNNLVSRITALEGYVHWISNALHFLIQKLGHSFVPPPHAVSTILASDKPWGLLIRLLRMPTLWPIRLHQFRL